MCRHKIHKLIVLSFCLIIFVFGVAIKMINQGLEFDFLDKICINFLVLSPVILFLLVIEFLLENRIYKGFKYFWNYWRIKSKLEHQMIDAKFGIERSYYIELPQIQLSFNNDLSCGTLKINNSLKLENKLDNVVMSSALIKFIVERHYLSDDENFYVYELVDGSVSFKLKFDSFKQFLEYNKKIPTYSFFLDSRSVVSLQHTLLVGQTGSGKSYEMYNLILQMLNKQIHFNLYYADPKNSGLAVIGSVVATERTAVEFNDIIDLLENFVNEMNIRKKEMKELLNTKIEADYSTFGLSPYVFICDEYASFASVLASQEKKIRDKVKSLLYSIILQGRQLGFFVFLILQKSDATLIDTALRENIPLKLVLGNSEQQTYVTTFGTGVEILNRNFSVGEGVFTEPRLAPEPKLVQCACCNFDILSACKLSPRDLITGAPENNK